MHRRRSALSVAVVVVAALSVTACVRPSPPAPPTTAPAPPTTTPPPTSTTMPALTCEETMTAFLDQATAGSYTTPALQVSFGPIAPLGNPPTAAGTGTPSTVTVSFTAYGPTGAPQPASPAAPVTVTVWGGSGTLSGFTPAAVVGPRGESVVTVTSGSTVSFDYDGGFLTAPLTVQASQPTGATNVCTGTGSVALGSTTVPLAERPVDTGTSSSTLPVKCPDGVDPADCPVEVVADALKVQAAVGFGVHAPSAGQRADFTIDTGSIGTAVPIAELGPDAVGPGAPAYKYYDSSGNEFAGYLYLAPVTLVTDAGSVTTAPVRVLAVVTSACATGSSCVTPPDPTTFHYLGVGFDRNTPSPAAPLASPTDNSLLQVLPSSGGTISPGFAVSASGVTVGVTGALRSQFTLASLDSSPTVPGDFATAPGTVTLSAPDGPPVTAAATILVDTGITEMFLAAEPHTFPRPLPGATTIALTIGVPTALSYSFTTNPDGSTPDIGAAPASVVPVRSSSGTFVNTGRNVLYRSDYLFDAAAGAVGFRPLADPLR